MLSVVKNKPGWQMKRTFYPATRNSELLTSWLICLNSGEKIKSSQNTTHNLHQLLGFICSTGINFPTSDVILISYGEFLFAIQILNFPLDFCKKNYWTSLNETRREKHFTLKQEKYIQKMAARSMTLPCVLA